MLFAFWQLKTIAFGLLLASSLGHQLLRTCERDYCYERSVESRNIETDNLRKLYGDESRRADTAPETENLDNISIGLRENRLDQFSAEFITEIRQELTTLAENRRELVRHEPSRREPYQLIIEINGRSVESDFNGRVEKTPKSQRTVKLLLERRQETNTDHFRIPISRLNERENRQERNELRYENHEHHTFNDRLSMRQHRVFQHSAESQAEREIIDRQSRHSSDHIIESERNLLERRERNLEERVNREYRRSAKQTTDRKPEPVQRRNQIKKDDRNLNEILTRSVLENTSDVARREFENSETKRFNERLSERNNEFRFENLRRERENEDDLLDTYDSRLDERERSNRRSIQQLSERTQKSIQRRERRVQEHDNGLKGVQRSSSRLDLSEPLTEERENLRQLNKRERNQKALKSIEINRREHTDNREFERSNRRLSAQRWLTERENERSNKHLSNIDENRVSQKPSQRIIEREERNVQRRIANENINNRLTEKEFTQRRVGDTRKCENNSRQPEITQQEQRLEVFNRRVEQRSVNAEFTRNRRPQHRCDNSPERQNVFNRNLDSQRFSKRLIEGDVENVDNGGEEDEHVHRIISSRRSEQRNIHRLADENQISRRFDERGDENRLLTENPSSRRTSVSENKRKSLEQRDICCSEFAPRHEELFELDEEDKRRVPEFERSRERILENIRECNNQNLFERKLRNDTNRDLETRRSKERRDRIESTRNNHQMVFRNRKDTKLHQRRDESKRERREERENLGFETLSNRNVGNRRDFQFIVDEYKETPSDPLTNSNMAYVQGVLLAIVIMKTLNGKNNVKCQVSQKFQKAIAMLGF